MYSLHGRNKETNMKKSKKKRRKKEGLRSKIEHSSVRMQQRLKSDGKKIVMNPEGELKMSEVLLKFVEPLLEFNKEDDNFKTIIGISIAAWNLSLLPEDRQEEAKKEFIEGFVNLVPEVYDASVQIVEMLIERKKTEFADIKRFIKDYEIVNTEYGPRINVASTLSKYPNG